MIAWSILVLTLSATSVDQPMEASFQRILAASVPIEFRIAQKSLCIVFLLDAACSDLLSAFSRQAFKSERISAQKFLVLDTRVQEVRAKIMRTASGLPNWVRRLSSPLPVPVNLSLDSELRQTSYLSGIFRLISDEPEIAISVGFWAHFVSGEITNASDLFTEFLRAYSLARACRSLEDRTQKRLKGKEKQIHLICKSQSVTMLEKIMEGVEITPESVMDVFSKIYAIVDKRYPTIAIAASVIPAYFNPRFLNSDNIELVSLFSSSLLGTPLLNPHSDTELLEMFAKAVQHVDFSLTSQLLSSNDPAPHKVLRDAVVNVRVLLSPLNAEADDQIEFTQALSSAFRMAWSCKVQAHHNMFWMNHFTAKTAAQLSANAAKLISDCGIILAMIQVLDSVCRSLKPLSSDKHKLIIRRGKICATGLDSISQLERRFDRSEWMAIKGAASNGFDNLYEVTKAILALEPNI